MSECLLEQVVDKTQVHFIIKMSAILTSQAHQGEPQTTSTRCCGFSFPNFILNPNLTLLLLCFVSYFPPGLLPPLAS